jgi:photosystem II stability/assembly factor-like uncharacterized protein
MRPFYIIIILFSFGTSVFGQPSSESEILASYQARKKMAETSLLKNYPARNIGPTIQGGRIIDIDVNQKDPKEFYVAYASGGIFKTVNNGITFEPIFDNIDALGLGDMALSQSDPKIIYAGTGEKNSSRSSYAGSGMYKTVDGGKTWQHLGLAATQHISRVVIDPQNNNTVWVASMGTLYTNNEARGVFKTTDGGKTWKKTLYINDSTGIIDLMINPKNPKQLWAASWERTRKADNFKGNGLNSSIYRSEDGGETWSKSVNGFPQNRFVGRIGLELCASQPNVLYAILDNQSEVQDLKKDKKKDDKLKLEDFRQMSKEDFLKLDDQKLNDAMKDNGLPKKYTAEIVKKEIREGKYTPKAIAEYFGSDANANLFKTKIAGAEVYRSNDGGSSWKKMNSYDLDGVFYTYGYYFAEMKVAPDNADLIYIYGVPMLKSRDGGATWHRLDTLSGVRELHVDHHALWINPNDSKHILLGNDGGLYQSYDEGANWLHINNMPVGQFYTVNVDMETPYNVYGGLQDNGVLKGSSESIPNETKHWKPIFSGDGMYVAADPRNSNLVYTGYQFGNYYRLELDKKSYEKITPQHNIGEPPLRWNWRTPLALSHHNPEIIYLSSNKVFRSFNKGVNWEVISEDLTRNKKQGNVPISTISSFAESPIKFGLLYAGTDDGNLWVSKDGGSKWDLIVNGLPTDHWISSVSPSPKDEATVFVSLNGYRNDNYKTHLYMSNDYGKTWKSVKGNLPESVANVIIQDPVNADLLYCGLDNGTYVSLDKGNTWSLFNGMLNVASYDMIVHPRDNDLVVATHGRSVYVADVKPLQALKDGGINKGVIAFVPKAIQHSESWGEQQFGWEKVNEPKVEVFYYVGKATQSIQVEVYNEQGKLVRNLTTEGSSGFHSMKWDLKTSPVTVEKAKTKKTVNQAVQPSPYAQKGKYKLKFINGSENSEVTLEVK